MTATEGARRPGRPPQISSDQILSAMGSFPNIDAVTMRELAAVLGVRHAALYRWVGNRDGLFDLVGRAVVDHVVERSADLSGDWRANLGVIVRALRDEFVAVPGYATHLSRPHPHSAHSSERLRDVAVDLMVADGVDAELARQSWQVLIVSVIGWLASAEHAVESDPDQPEFDEFLGVLLRGLPVQPGSA